MWPGPRPTCTPSFVLIRPTVWPQCTNVTDRQTDRQTGQDRTVQRCIVWNAHNTVLGSKRLSICTCHLTQCRSGLAISRSRVQILLEATLRNNFRQVVYTYVPLSPCSITWYRSKGGDALRLGMQAWRKVMAAYRRVDDLRSPAG